MRTRLPSLFDDRTLTPTPSLGLGLLGELGLTNSLGRLTSDLGQLTIDTERGHWTITDQTATLTYDLPGVALADIDLRAKDGYLTLTATRRSTQTPEGARIVGTYRQTSTTRQSWAIDNRWDRDTITADLANGVLTVVLTAKTTTEPDDDGRIAITNGNTNHAQLDTGEPTPEAATAPDDNTTT